MNTGPFIEEWLFNERQEINAEIEAMNKRHERDRYIDETIFTPLISAVVFGLALAVYELTCTTYPAWF